MGSSFRRARLVRRAGLTVACGALVALAVVLVSGGGEDTVSMWVSVVSAVVAVCTFAVDLVRGAGPEETGPADPPEDVRRRAAAALADAVRVQWSAEARRLRLRDPEPLAVRWEPVGPPFADRAPGVPVPAPRDEDQRPAWIIDAFKAVRSGRWVVLGEPGAGKSVMAVRFVLGMLEARQQGGPVPVLFALAGWDPGASTLRGWLADRLAKDYGSLAATVGDGRTLAQELLDAGLVLPVLDGFDEIPPGAYESALYALNSELDPGQPVLLTSRTAAWADAVERGGVPTGVEVVRLRPLDSATVRAYLTRTARSGAAWAPVLDDPPPPLTEALRSPLTVTLARTVYEDPSRDPAELTDSDRFPTAERVEEHLLDAFVPTAFAGPGGRWHPQAAHRWLGRIARDLTDSAGSLAWWELATVMPRPLRVLGPAVWATLATAALLVPIAKHGGGVIADWDTTESAVLNFAGILTGLCVGLTYLLPPTPRTAQGLRWLARTALRTTVAAAVVGVGLGLLVPPLVSSRLGAVLTPRPSWYLNGCCFGLILSMMFAVAGLSRRPGPLGLPWAGSPSGPQAVRALGALLAFAGLAVYGYTNEQVSAATCVVSGLVLASLGRTDRPAGTYVAPATALRGFARGLLRGLVACTLIGVCAGAVVGAIGGTFAAVRVHSAPNWNAGKEIAGWRLARTADGERTVHSTKPWHVLLVKRSALDEPFAVAKGARISRDDKIDTFEGRLTIRPSPDGGWVTDWPDPSAAGRGEPVDAHNLVLALPDPVRLWLVRRDATSVVLDAVGPLVAFGVLVGMIGGCASGVYRALDTPSDTIRAVGPRSTLRTDRTATLARSAVAALLAGSVCLLLIAATGRGSTLGTMHTELWVPVGTSALALSAWGRTATARCWLALTGRAPWRLMTFLEDAHRRGVLRQSGARYEFRHQRLQRRLAATAAPSADDRPDVRRLVCLTAVAVAAYALAYVSGRPLLDDRPSTSLGPSETAQVITAVGALSTAIGMSLAAMIKAVALLIHARADMERARTGRDREPLPEPEGESSTSDDRV
ncbi:NACHT domain-containing protein [Streptomyces aurantiacus]|uniref:NACHT domain-containing protein n=1 Tax=Streptomyces aurantiacus TaxID=47760 RepID=UPI0006E2DE2A|nr:NACHT domain-containing protein [Streptomyces aurantiacus]